MLQALLSDWGPTLGMLLVLLVLQFLMSACCGEKRELTAREKAAEKKRRSDLHIRRKLQHVASGLAIIAAHVLLGKVQGSARAILNALRLYEC